MSFIIIIIRPIVLTFKIIQFVIIFLIKRAKIHKDLIDEG